jgi:hypothetical protein
VCTVIGVAPELWRPFAGPIVRVDARMEIAHRLLLRAIRSGDVAYAAAEALCDLLRARDGSRQAPAVVDAAREAILTGHPAACGLIPLAQHLQTSPFIRQTAHRSDIESGFCIISLIDSPASIVRSSSLGNVTRYAIC